MIDLNELKRYIQRAIAPVRAQVTIMISRCVVEKVDDAKMGQALDVEIQEGQLIEAVENCQPYGVSFRPPVGSEAIILSVGGSRAVPLVIGAYDRNKRPKEVAEHEGGLYNLGEWRVFCDKDGIVHLGEKSGAEFVALAEKVDSEIAKIRDAINNAAPVPGMDGGTALHNTMKAGLAASPAVSVAATKVKAS